LRNQIQYQGQRCPAVAEASAAVKSAAPPDSAKAVTEGPELKPTTVQPPKIEPAKVEAPKIESHVVEPPKVEAAKKVSDSPSKSVAKSEYSVQVAAYNHKADAEKLVSTLGKRGYSARVDGDTIPFRVRIGRYSTATEAEDALKKIKAKHMDGFVVRAPER
jgi:cell division protein FtsN